MAASCVTTIDWDATGSMLSGLGTIGGAVVVLIAALIGKDTFDTWKRQKLEERKIVLAESALTLAFKLQPAISSIRSPFSLAGEIERAEASLREQDLINDQTPQARVQPLTTAQTALNRIASYAGLIDSLAELRPSVRAIFGSDVEAKLAVFENSIREVRTAAFGISRTGRAVYPNEQVADQDYARAQRFEAKLWEDSVISDDGQEAVDPIKKAVADAVTDLEKLFRPYFDATAKG
ncbi:hypothetical protein QP179_03295 [Sphingomonas aurantiaca]|uniref:hypothetical protein n=1 Tax=Sphingomonas aurantiaca TaxID=185949 RepID=UPI002FE3E8CA